MAAEEARDRTGGEDSLREWEEELRRSRAGLADP